MSDSGWVLSGELSQDVSAHLEQELEILSDLQGLFPPTLSRFEQADSDLWRVDIFFSERPSETFVEELLDKSGLQRWRYEFSPIEDRDWVSESQKLLAPVRAGRFFVFGSHDADQTQETLVNLQIDAGQAFGTGKHETTAACLSVIDSLVDKIKPNTILDLGTGSGLLAFAAAKVWPDAMVTGSDIDPIAIEVAEHHRAVNDLTARSPGTKQRGVALVVADGINDGAVKADAPYDLVIANILAGPLIEMAPDIESVLARRGTLVLSGLLVSQIDDVLAPYLSLGLSHTATAENGEWAALKLDKKQ